MNAPHFSCYAPRPEAHLPAIDRAALYVIRQAKGFFRSSGMSLADVAVQVSRTFGVKVTAVVLREVMERLKDAGLVKAGVKGWRR